MPVVPPPPLDGADALALDEGEEPAAPAAEVDDDLAVFELLLQPAAMKAIIRTIAAAPRIRERRLPLKAVPATLTNRVDFASLRILSTFPRSFKRIFIRYEPPVRIAGAYSLEVVAHPAGAEFRTRFRL
jgi:hypothetical protein